MTIAYMVYVKESHDDSCIILCVCHILHFFLFQLLSSEAVQRLTNVRQKAEVELKHFNELEEPVPEPFSQKVQQIDVLQASIQVCVTSNYMLVSFQHCSNSVHDAVLNKVSYVIH